MGHMTLCTYSNASFKRGDDSTIVFRIQNNLFTGRIRSIFTLDENNSIFLLVGYPTATNYFTCCVDNNDKFKYASIQSCLKKDFSILLIKIIDIVEKCVYFEHSSGKCYFMRFPNLIHSS